VDGWAGTQQHPQMTSGARLFCRLRALSHIQTHKHTHARASPHMSNDEQIGRLASRVLDGRVRYASGWHEALLHTGRQVVRSPSSSGRPEVPESRRWLSCTRRRRLLVSPDETWSPSDCARWNSGNKVPLARGQQSTRTRKARPRLTPYWTGRAACDSPVWGAYTAATQPHGSSDFGPRAGSYGTLALMARYALGCIVPESQYEQLVDGCRSAARTAPCSFLRESCVLPEVSCSTLPSHSRAIQLIVDC